MINHVFTYGSLMFKEIFMTVTGEKPHFKSATLRHWRRYSLKDKAYPGAAVCQDENAQINGVLWSGVSAQGIYKLDAFEGAEYCRQAVTVLTEGGQPQTAWIYRWIDESLFCGAWDIDAFEHRHRADFLATHWQTYSTQSKTDL